MNRRLWLCSLALGSLTLVSCGPETAPTEVAGEDELSVGASSSAGGTWTTRAPMPTPRFQLAVGVQNNSLGQPVLYAMGGFDPGFGVTRAVEAYNFATDRWTTRARLRLPLWSTNGVGNIGGKLYLSGGFFETADGLSGWHPGLHIYDPVRNTWTKGADMPKRVAQGISGVIKGKLYVLTGTCNNCGPNRITRRLFRYDPITNSWTTSLPWCPNAHVLGAGGVINGKFYVAGGLDRDNRASNKLDVYDPATNRWRSLAPMPTARYGIAGAVVDNRLYIIGRTNADPGERQGEVESYNPVTDTWRTHTPMPGAGRGELAGARVTYQGRSHIIALGGTDVEGSSPGNVNQVFTPPWSSGDPEWP
jgi:N-acetylneuraminic acid mutarotase